MFSLSYGQCNSGERLGSSGMRDPVSRMVLRPHAGERELGRGLLELGLIHGREGVLLLSWLVKSKGGEVECRGSE